MERMSASEIRSAAEKLADDQPAMSVLSAAIAMVRKVQGKGNPEAQTILREVADKMDDGFNRLFQLHFPSTGEALPPG